MKITKIFQRCYIKANGKNSNITLTANVNGNNSIVNQSIIETEEDEK